MDHKLLSPLIQREVKRLDARIAVAHRRIARDQNADEEADVIDRLSPAVDAMEKTGQLQEYIARPVAKAKPKVAVLRTPHADPLKDVEHFKQKIRADKGTKGEIPRRSKGPAEN